MVCERRWREPARRAEKWLGHQRRKVERSLAALGQAAPSEVVVDVASIALACTLDYLDLRFAGAWRDDHADLVT
jgi:glutathione S-transferase